MIARAWSAGECLKMTPVPNHFLRRTWLRMDLANPIAFLSNYR